MSLSLRTVTTDNVGLACRITVAPDQQSFVAPVAESLAEAYTQPDVAWPRLIYRDDQAVGFVMAGFDPQSPLWFFRCGIWRLNVSAAAQRQGVGRFAATSVLDEARSRGCQRASVLWKPGDAGPEGFYLGLGFRPTGELFHDQVIGAINL